MYPHIFSRHGEWIGWVTGNRQVYSVHGHYVGYLSNDPRILRKKSSGYLKPRHEPPPEPEKFIPPIHVPLPPLLPEVPIGAIDVLEERPDLLPPIDFGDLKADLD